MPVINGKLNSSSFSGIVRFTPDVIFVDFSTTPDTIVALPIEATITNGSFSITVPQSQNLSGQPGVTTESVTYKIELLRNDQSLIQPSFHAVVPDSGTAIDFTTLISVPAQTPYLDISLFRIANILTDIPTYRDKISSKFNIRGAYDPAISYVLNDMVDYQGNSYLWRNASSLAGQTPPLTGSNANWFMLAKKGDTGTGTTASIVGYSQATWNNSNQASARGDVEDAITAVIGMIPDTANFLTKTEGAPKNNPVFTGKMQRDPMTYPVAVADLPKEVITAGYLEAAISTISSNKLTKPLVFARKVSSQSFTLGSRSTITFDNRIINVGGVLDTNGNFTVPETGDYLVYCKLRFTFNGAFASNQCRCQIRAIFARTSPSASDYGDFFYDNFGTVNDVWNVQREGMLVQTGLNAGEVFQVRGLIESQQLGGTGNTGLQSSGNGLAGVGSVNHLYIWRFN